MITSSELACLSTGTKPLGSRSAEYPCVCGVCGGVINKGELVDDMVFSKSFSNHDDLFDESLENRCGYCTAILVDTKFILNYSTCVYTKTEAYPFSKKINRAWFLINPPEPPFALSVQATKSQHVVWRTPVSLSKEVFFIQLGESTLKIRHKFLMDALKATEKIRDAQIQSLEAKAIKAKKKPKKVDRNTLRPLGYAEMKGQMLHIGELQWWVTKLIDDGYLSQTDVEPLLTLNWGEAWALDTVSTEGKNAPEKPGLL